MLNFGMLEKVLTSKVTSRMYSKLKYKTTFFNGVDIY